MHNQKEKTITVCFGKTGSYISAVRSQEFSLLAKAANVHAVDSMLFNVIRPHAKSFINSGQLEQLSQKLLAEEVKLVLFDCTLSPSQERNLEKALEARVLDRTGLILDIFAQRARTYEGKLQVELAQLEHLATRLVRGWTHLERQKGGIGLRGPGETQLETDRRLLQNRVSAIKSRLAKVKKQRSLSRHARHKSQVPTVSLVGYTNAGKSTLFNQLTQEKVYAADQLFATLDPTLRKVKLPNKKNIIVADTVGFIRDLPHELVSAFQATLEETRLSDVLLHVIDVSDPERVEHANSVQEVLNEIGANSVPVIEVFNKIDESEHAPHIEYNENGLPCRVFISARLGLGLNSLLNVIQDRLFFSHHYCIKLLPSEGELLAKLHRSEEVLSETYDEFGHVYLELKQPKLQTD